MGVAVVEREALRVILREPFVRRSPAESVAAMAAATWCAGCTLIFPKRWARDRPCPKCGTLLVDGLDGRTFWAKMP